MSSPGITVRKALSSDVPHIQRLIGPYVSRRILLGKDDVTLYGSIQQFRIATGPDGVPIGCGALNVFWNDIAEVRTLALDEAWIRHGVGHRLLQGLEDDARALGIGRIFCLTFEVDFFTKHGYLEIGESVVSPEVYAELVRSTDEGVAEFLDLARVKPNTLGNTRMLKVLPGEAPGA
jgi:amino-acid N-acetyltransferase